MAVHISIFICCTVHTRIKRILKCPPSYKMMIRNNSVRSDITKVFLVEIKRHDSIAVLAAYK